MPYCTKCGKQTDWTSKSGYCKECAADELNKTITPKATASNDGTKKEQAMPTPGPAPTSKSSHSPSLNGWIAAALVSCVLGGLCLLMVGLGGFDYVGGDAYNLIITGIVALFWIGLGTVLAVIGAAVLLGNINSNK